MSTTYIGDWKIDASTDSDEHLTVFITHAEDDSEIIEIDQDLLADNNEWAGRFTTARIEKEYQDQQ